MSEDTCSTGVCSIHFISPILFYRLKLRRNILILFCLLGQAVFASGLKIDSLKHVTVEQVRVSGTKKTVNPVQVLTTAELEKTNSLTVADAVRHLSGVQLKDYGGIGGLKTINVRSLGSLHTAILYDGVQLGNAQNGQVDLGKFSLESIESLELYNGQSNRMLQPARAQASSSVLYLKSQMPHFERDRKDHLKATFKTGSFGLVDPSFLWQHKLKQGIATTLSAELTEAEGKYKFQYHNGPIDTLLNRENTDVRSYRVEGALHGIAADSSKWSLRIYNYLSERGLPAAVVDVIPGSLQRYRDNDFFVQASYEKNVSKRYSMLLHGKYSYNYNRYKDRYYQNEVGLLDNRYEQNEFYASIANRYTLSSNWTIGLAADVIRSSMQANLNNFPKPVRTISLMAFQSTYETHKLSLQGALVGTFTYETTTAGDGAIDKQVLSPSVSLGWTPFGPSFKVSYFYKNTFRLPTFNDQYYTLSGNSNLAPEFTNQHNVGFSYAKTALGKLENLQFDLNAYSNSVKDRIISLPKGGIFWTMENIGQAQIKGIDASIRALMGIKDEMKTSFRLNYTYQDARDHSQNDYYGKLIPYSPKHSGSTTLSVFKKHYGFNYNFIYTGSYSTLRPNLRSDFSKPWYTHDLSVFQVVNLGGDNLKLTAEANNVFNQWYSVVRNYPMPGRSYRFSIQFYY